MGRKRFGLIAGLVGAAVLLMGASSWAQMKIGYIDPEEILAKYKPFQVAQKDYGRYEQELNREFTKRQNELEKMKEAYDRQKLLLSEKRKQEEQQSILKKQEELQRFLTEITAQDGKLARKNQELSEPVFKKVNEIVQKVAKDEGYDFVLNTSALAYAAEAHNLTEMVLEALEKNLEEEEKQREEAGQ